MNLSGRFSKGIRKPESVIGIPTELAQCRIRSLSTTLLILRITQNWWRDKEEYVKLIAATSVKKWHGENERACHNGRFSCVLGTEMTLISGKKHAMT